MRDFADLFLELDQTNKILPRVEALANYFRSASDHDKIWTIAILSHRRPKRAVNTTLLRHFAADAAGIPLWLFEESYHVVGDLAESIALVLPQSNESNQKKSLSQWIESIANLKDAEEDEKRTFVVEAWASMDYAERFVFNKLITGGFRLGISQKLMTRALSQATGIPEESLAHRLMGDWSPFTTNFEDLVLSGDHLEEASKPYPFYLAYALDDQPDQLGEVAAWQAEWKWDGIRGQLICRKDEIFIWSRGEELVTNQFPEFIPLSESIPNGTVLDGELLVFRDGQIQPFNDLQTRLGRKTVSKKMLAEYPMAIIAYDMLEHNGVDIRERPLSERRKLLEQTVDQINLPHLIRTSPIIEAIDWTQLEEIRKESRDRSAEGMMLKRKSAPYLAGRKKGDWWKWKVDPMTIDAVMIYAQRGHGRRANLYTDYTFAVWDGDQLVPFTKAYSGLTDKEFTQVTAFVNKNTLERFGPVRSVKAELVFEIAFEGIRSSPRHKSGIALRFPRISRWRQDKPVAEINTLEDLKRLL